MCTSTDGVVVVNLVEIQSIGSLRVVNASIVIDLKAEYGAKQDLNNVVEFQYFLYT